jgi:DNA-binding NarL/FixJ family response regulator
MSITVFLADDHTVLRNGLQFMLDAEADIEVVGTAANGRDAVRQVKQLHPDIVVLDIAMPELNGIEAAQQIREYCSSTQVIILSMHHTPEHINRALQAGARGYLVKESASDEVVEAIRQVHAGRRYLSQEISEQVLDYYIDQHQAKAASDPLASLNAREREILQLVVEGKTTAEISDLLSLSPKSVKSYRSRIMQKLGVNDLPGLVKFAIRHGLTSLE